MLTVHVNCFRIKLQVRQRDPGTSYQIRLFYSFLKFYKNCLLTAEIESVFFQESQKLEILKISLI